MSNFIKAFLLAFIAFPFAANAVTVASWGGAYTESQIKAYKDTYSNPDIIQFENYNGGLGEVRAQVESGNVAWDLVDVLPDQTMDTSLLEKTITKKTKAIMPVHLTGRMCNMKLIYEISKKYNIPIIEDAAQSIGSKFNNKFPGHYSKLACYSAHPLKNLNAFGDSGYITTNNYNIAKMAKTLSNHGIQDRNKINFFGFVSRMDNLQAGILNFHLKNLKKIIRKRRKNAEIYYKILNRDKIFIPIKNKYNYDTFHTFVIQVNKRKELQKYLLSKGVMTSIHYPVPIHLQPASKHLGYKKGDFPIAEKQSNRILSIPINQYLSENKIIKISHLINKFFN